MVPLEAGQLMKDDVGVEAEVELVLVGIRVQSNLLNTIWGI